jgi:hypothetical protein
LHSRDFLRRNLNGRVRPERVCLSVIARYASSANGPFYVLLIVIPPILLRVYILILWLFRFQCTRRVWAEKPDGNFCASAAGQGM